MDKSIENEFERRPNPAGWVQPKAPYNPYDPADRRPSKGYPSEFDAPGVKKNSGKIAQDATDFSRIRVDMKKLQYFPRPPSQLYPGRYKVLRRVKNFSNFEKGANLVGKGSIWAITIFGVFFYKWNDHNNVLSPFRRFQLRIKEFVFGGLNTRDYDDLYNYDENKIIPQKPLPSVMYESAERDNFLGDEETNNEFIKDRFGFKHVVYAESIRQKQEETAMRERDLEERNKELLSLKQDLRSSKIDKDTKKQFWKLW
ncbi:hypothetical protein CANARDRAFT_8266 [[Candida] arabinofermentans NRRL YB-2248]|uniref:Uncharacterized protein n=1 Tax=[Candida] arabinofermentans NRRL YB-2248 TaxID=983967 RepID=A0A1E4SYV1_9ASCO|nr:hypothetical protein CANARDRAFT_8266 [[Candida] arabinofermentans NRRL YB-2248]